jgi:predicted metalloendopeptidase
MNTKRIDKLDWMAPATRAQAQAKLKTLYVGIGYPEPQQAARAGAAPAYPDAWYPAFDVKPGQSLYLAPAERVRVW